MTEVGFVTCEIGRQSPSYDGGCGWAIVGAYLGLVAIWPASKLGETRNPSLSDPVVSGWALLAGYAVGAALGAAVGWNLSKRLREEGLSLEPIERAGPPQEAMAAWREPLVRSSARGALAPPSIGIPLVAFAF